MATPVRFTIADLEVMPDDGNRYEVIDGELFVSTQLHYAHQTACSNIVILLGVWNRQRRAGVVTASPCVIFGESDAVAPDVVWVSSDRLPNAVGADGKFHGPPDLVVKVLSPGIANERRDRDVKRKLYSVRGVREYWIVNWQAREVAVYRREEPDPRLVATLYGSDMLSSPLLPGFEAPVEDLFYTFPAARE